MDADILSNIPAESKFQPINFAKEPAMKSSLPTAMGYLVVVALVASTASAQTYQQDYRGVAQDRSSNPNTEYPSTRSHDYSLGTRRGNADVGPYGYSHTRPDTGSYRAVNNDATYGYSTADPTTGTQASDPEPQAQSNLAQPAQESVLDSYNGSQGGGGLFDPYQSKLAQWMISADAVYMTRVAGNSYPLLTDPSTGPPETVVLDAADFDFDYEFGVRAAASRMICDGWGIESGFFTFLDDWGYDQTFTGNFRLQGPGWTGTSFPGATSLRVLNTTKFYSGELNAVRGICDWATLRAGVRYIDVNDRLDVDELLVPVNNALVSTCDNDLLGFQLGGDFKLLELRGFGPGMFTDACTCGAGYGSGSCVCQASRFRINATVNCGLLYNNFQNNVSGVPFGPPAGATASVATEGNEVALLGEAALMAKYRFTDHVAVRAGYQILALHGVALAPDQIATTDMGTGLGVPRVGSLVAHGATLGIEVFW